MALRPFLPSSLPHLLRCRDHQQQWTTLRNFRQSLANLFLLLISLIAALFAWLSNSYQLCSRTCGLRLPGSSSSLFLPVNPDTVAKKTSLNEYHPNLLRTTSRFFGYIVLRRVFELIQRILVRHLPEKLRRTQNAAINLSARARLRANHLDRPHQSDQLSQDVQVSDMDMANNPYDPHQQNQEAGSSSDEGEVDLCMCMYFQLTHWLSKKFKLATRRHRETRAQLDFLLSKQNPFKPPGRNYQVSYFEKKWNHQRTFRADHTDEEQERRNKLIKIYEHQATIDKLRSRQLQKDAEGISDLPPDEENQIVHTSGASHSRTLDANKTGPRVGTDRKEEISEAMWKRKLAFKKLLNKYNKLYSEFSKTFPTHPAANSPLHPVDYDDFLKWPLDHESWNDGLYFQTTAP
ncbi:hypothetical protein PSHT_01355, partial [Puccinia striiformis]